LSGRWLLVALLLAAPARAEDDARAYFERATAQFALGKYAEAASNFERCFELRPDPPILYNAAQARRLSGNKQRALELYSSYLRIYGSRIDNRAEVERHIENLKAAIAKDQQVLSSPPIATKPPAPESKPPPVVEKPKPAPKPAPVAVVEKPKPAPAPVVPVVVEPKPAPVVVAEPAPAPAAPQLVAQAPERPKPIYKKGWFWGAVVGGVAVVAVAVSLGAVYGTPAAKNPDPTFGTARGN
jgi:tetratricopeptide (TPR) repeat protein